jgi:hypothetical protein
VGDGVSRASVLGNVGAAMPMIVEFRVSGVSSGSDTSNPAGSGAGAAAAGTEGSGSGATGSGVGGGGSSGSGAGATGSGAGATGSGAGAMEGSPEAAAW